MADIFPLGSSKLCGMAEPATVLAGVARVTAVPGTAVEVDYIGLPIDLYFEEGEVRKSFYVFVADDFISEDEESFKLRLDVVDPLGRAKLGTPAEMEVRILNNATPPTVEFAENAVSVGESTAHFDYRSTLRTTRVTQPFDVTISVVAGSATAGTDYIAFSERVTVYGPTPTLLGDGVVILDDLVVEGNETFTIQLSNPSNGVAFGPNAAITVTILDETPSPEDLYGHGLELYGMQVVSASGRNFKVHFQASNPSRGDSNPARIEARILQTGQLLGNVSLGRLGGTDRREYGGGRTITGTMPEPPARVTWEVFFYLYEETANGSLLQDTRLAYSLTGVSPPSSSVGGIAVNEGPLGGGAVLSSVPGRSAPGFTGPPTLRELRLYGSPQVLKGSSARYRTEGILTNDEVVPTTPSWSAGAYRISSDGELFVPADATQSEVEVTAQVTIGGEKLTIAKRVRLSTPGALTVERTEGGKVSAGFAGTTVRTVGQTYSIKATPLAGYLFRGWTGDFPTTASTVIFA